MNKGGDTLASGGIRAQFPPAGGNVTQEKWDSIFSELTTDEAKQLKPVKKSKKKQKK